MKIYLQEYPNNNWVLRQKNRESEITLKQGPYEFCLEGLDASKTPVKFQL